MRPNLPSGTVTFLFTDVEGSTKLLHELGAERYARALAEHRRVLRQAFSAHGGVEVDTQGDAFFVAFPTAPGALAAAEQAVAALEPGQIRVRVGIHTGTPHLAEEGYVGADVHRAARIAAAGHGGQVLVSAATAALVGSAALRDLGEHRFKDLSAPERLYQLGDGTFPPLKSLHQTNLPVPATPFLGRERELAEVSALIARDDVRLLTLTGPGGTGKTRLALQAAGESAESFPAGVWWVPLASLRDPALVLDTAASALGTKDALTDHIADRALLLYFDNFEHVIDAADELPGLLASCRNLRVVVTSRELLRVPGEHAYAVPPLEPPEGVELFVARARAADAAFEPTEGVAELCERLEQLPLALELAAARVRLLSPKQLLERLSGRLDLLKAGRGVDPRQQTLRATIEWSHELLDANEQRLFARLAVFVGGCTVDAAEQVCDADLDVLQSLVDKSLVRVREDNRFWMLETIREYATERLDASGEASDVRRRHADHYLALAEDAEPAASAHSREALERLELEHDNLRAALDWFEASGATNSSLRLAGALAEFWGIKGHLVEGRRRLERILRADERPTAARAKALNKAADLASETATTRDLAEEALTLHRALEDRSGEAWSLVLLGDVAGDDRDWEAARDRWAESARLFREAGDVRNALLATRLLGWAYSELGDDERSRQTYAEALDEARVAGDKHMEAHFLEGLAHLVTGGNGIAEAARMIDEAYRIHVEIGDVYRIAISVCRFARALAAGGEAAIAAEVLGSGERLLEELGGAFPWVADINADALARIRAQLDDAAIADARNRGRLLTAEEAVRLALDALSEPRS